MNWGARDPGSLFTCLFYHRKPGSLGQVREIWLYRDHMPWNDGTLECWNTEVPRLAEWDLFL